MSEAQDQAINEIKKFAQETGNGQWTSIKRQDLVTGLTARVSNRNLINQGQTNLCGPTVFFYNLAGDNPVAYVKAAISLWENGNAKIGDLQIKSDDYLKTYNIPSSANIAPADWIVLASLRNDSNWFFQYHSTKDSLAAMTLPQDVVNWFKKTGYTEVIDKTRLLAIKSQSIKTQWDETANAQEANNFWAQGYKISILLNADMLAGNNKNKNINTTTPDHWVGMASRINIIKGNGRVNFRIFTWGALRPYDITLDTFRNCYYGFIACRR